MTLSQWFKISATAPESVKRMQPCTKKPRPMLVVLCKCKWAGGVRFLDKPTAHCVHVFKYLGHLGHI